MLGQYRQCRKDWEQLGSVHWHYPYLKTALLLHHTEAEPAKSELPFDIEVLSEAIDALGPEPAIDLSRRMVDTGTVSASAVLIDPGATFAVKFRVTID